MVKNEFISKLESLLSRVPEDDRREMLYDYEEHFEIGLANGKSEKDLIAELGDPYVIARDLLADYRVEKAEKDRTVSNIFHAIIASISLSFFNLVFVLGPVIGLLGVYIGLCATALALTLSPLVVIFSSVMGFSYESFTVNFFVSITLFSLGALLSIGMIYVGKFFYQIILRYIKFNIRVIKGGKAA
ncbi:DUF1700 domain-containing protein [Bacillus massilinigeriensis]|uniref:DUF1700 domain-containing protein n=1 Tax=Bacillus massilionigeriensis TaxID=1805475 RepID=UPI00096AF168|nr:DUF1700 domain-containing protein [Bacillus massilionigeriensis]